MTFTYVYRTIVGDMMILSDNDFITGIRFEKEIKNNNSSDYIFKEISIIKDIYKQLLEYFCGKRKKFYVQMRQGGTDFQQKVWKALEDIPYGETLSYKDIAIKIGNPKACKAVGMANNKNNLPILVPCHRVIGSNGKLVGYSSGLDIKLKLLELESKYF